MARGIYRNLFRKLDTVGDGTGINSATGNYSAGTGIFKYVPSKDVAYTEINRLIVYIKDTVVEMGDDYGNIKDGLINGIEVKLIELDGLVQDLTDGQPIKTNDGWIRRCFNTAAIDWGQQVLDSVTFMWDFLTSGRPLKIYKGEVFLVYCQDDMTGLMEHEFEIQGLEYYR